MAHNAIANDVPWEQNMHNHNRVSIGFVSEYGNVYRNPTGSARFRAGSEVMAVEAHARYKSFDR